MEDRFIPFVKRHGKILDELLSSKLKQLTDEVFDVQENRNEKIEAVKIIRSWLDEIRVVKNNIDNKPTTFV